VKFLIDNALSPIVADRLRSAGHVASHVRDYGMAAANDAVIFELAARDARVLVSADTDFGTLLSLRRETKPSAILLRRVSQRHPQEQVALLLANLPQIAEALEKGTIVVFEERRIRIRDLPIVRS